MADRFWVGNGGSVNDTAHWSTESGGAGGASVPTEVDDIYFDASSFSLSTQIVSGSTLLKCHNMDWTGATNHPTFTAAYWLYGSLTLISDMNMNYTTLYLEGNGSNTLKTAGHVFGFVYVEGSDGYWTLLDGFECNWLMIMNGTFDTNDQPLNCNQIYNDSTSGARELILRNSIVTVPYLRIASPLVLDAGTSTIIFSGENSTENILRASGYVFNSVEIQLGSTSAGGLSISRNCTIGSLKLLPGQIVNVYPSCEITLGAITGDGTTDDPVVLKSNLVGSSFNIKATSGLFKLYHYSITDCIATGGARFKVIDSIDNGGNTGWLFRNYTYPMNITEANRSDIIEAFKLAQDYKSKLISKIAEVQADSKVATFIAELYNPAIADLQNQIDGQISTWFYSGEPSLTVPPVANNPDPADDWSTDAIKNIHLGDLYYDSVTGYGYRFALISSTYQWISVDSDVAQALATAQAAQDTADGKRRVFVTTPTVPYDIGDLWTSGIAGDMLKCKTAKTAVETYSSDDWEPATIVSSWIYEQTSNFNGAMIETGTVLADAIKTGELTVGDKVGPGYLGTHIDGSGIYTGNIEASQITTTGLFAEKIYKPGFTDSYCIVGGDMGDLILYDDNIEWFRIYNSVSTAIFKYKTRPYLEAGVTTTAPLGAWDFTNAIVTGLHAQWG